MTKLTDSQLIVLSAAAARDDGLAVSPAKMNKAAAVKIGSSLVARKLMRELKAKAGMSVWREDEDGRPISLIITKAGRVAIGAEVGDTGEETIALSKSVKVPCSGSRVRLHSEKLPRKRNVDQRPRAGSKLALVIKMLGRKSGATLEALVEATGWLPHTTRAAFTGLRKRGFAIERSREGDASVYRVVETSTTAAAT
jgi:hypothetical protein